MSERDPNCVLQGKSYRYVGIPEAEFEALQKVKKLMARHVAAHFAGVEQNMEELVDAFAELVSIKE